MAQIYWEEEDLGIIQIIDLPAVVMESHEDALTVTSHPVEQGANVSDHAREEPTRLMLEVFVSNIPSFGPGASGKPTDPDASFAAVDIDVPGFTDPGTRTRPLEIPTPPIQKSLTGLVQAGVGALVRAVGGQPKGTFRDAQRRKREARQAQMLAHSSPRDRVRDTYEKLLELFQQKRLVNVVTEMREHFDMMIDRLPGRRDAEDGFGSTFELEFVRIRVADSETVESPQPAEKRGQVNKSGGSKNPSADPNAAAKEEKYESVLSSTGAGQIGASP